MRSVLPGLAAVCLALFAACAHAQRVSDVPEGARFVTEDLDRFWAAWDRSGGPLDAEALQRGYLDPGSAGLAAFTRLRIGSAGELAKSIAARPAYYGGLRRVADAIPAQRARYVAAFEALEALYAPAVFPDVYFLVGRMNSAGTLDEVGLLIGTDMYGRHGDAALDGLSDWHRKVVADADALPHIVAHELIHYQQTGGGDGASLLEQSIAEGAADYLAERISGAHINARAHAYGLANECALWRDFEPHRDGADYRGFLFGGEQPVGRPPDTGYFVGYRIVQAYLERHGTSKSTLRRILDRGAADEVLLRSGYSPCDTGARVAHR